MKAISLKQPWAWAVMTPGVDKDVENRTWWSDYRGPVWIASSAQVQRSYYERAADKIEIICGKRPPPLKELPLGVILGRVEVVDYIPPDGWRNGVKGAHPLHPAKWHDFNQYGYVMDHSRRVVLSEPVPCKGLQRYWSVPQSVSDAIARQGAA